MSVSRILLKAIRSVIVLIPLVPALAFGQQQKEDDDPNKVSNDTPTRPIQMPAASGEVREAFDDFDRFKRRGAWERATKALYAIPEAQAARFIDGSNNFIIPVARKRHEVLTGLSAEGLAAYRLFYDTDAKKLLDAAEGTAEQGNLEKIFSSYFLTTIGDNAADRLGDLHFEAGRYDRAADCWLAVLRERTDTDLAPALMATKAAIALSKAGRRAEARALRTEIAERYRDEVVTIAGKKAKAVEQIARLVGDLDAVKPVAVASAAAPPGTTSPTLGAAVSATWQVRFGASVTAGMTPAEVAQWEANSLSMAVPRVAVDADKLFVNYLDHIFAVELATGKLLWRSASFHNVDISAMSDQARMIDASRYAIVAAPGFVWSLGRDIKDLNPQASSRLICRRADNGEVVWQSTNFADYEGIDFVGQPLLAPETLLITAKTAMNNMYGGQENMSKQFVLAIRPVDGKLLWKTEVGSFRSVQRYYYYAQRDTAAQPKLAYHAGAVYLDTHVGILARINLESGALEWGYGYPTDPVKQQGRIIFFGMTEDPTPIGAPPIPSGEDLLIKGAKSDHLTVIDPGAMKVVWDRPIAKSARPIGSDATTIYLGGPDLEALDRQTRALRWSLPMPEGSDGGTVLVRPDGLWQFTTRGIYEVDTQAGRVRRIFRGDDSGALGGDLLLTDRWLLAISNQTISAYPRGGPTADPAALKTTGAEPAPTTTNTRGSDE